MTPNEGLQNIKQLCDIAIKSGIVPDMQQAAIIIESYNTIAAAIPKADITKP